MALLVLVRSVHELSYSFAPHPPSLHAIAPHFIFSVFSVAPWNLDKCSCYHFYGPHMPMSMSLVYTIDIGS